MRSMEGRKQKSKDELSFTSPEFNPLSALYSDSVSVPYPDATTYDNVYLYESSLTNRETGTSQSSSKKGETSPSTSSGTARNTVKSITGYPTSVRSHAPSTLAASRKEAFLAMGIKIENKKPVKAKRNMWNDLRAGHQDGPLSMLTRCVNENLLVNVRTRNRHELRGCCRGYIVAFDKHMNLAMVDVDETYRNPLWLSKSARRRRRKAPECQAEKCTQQSEDQSSDVESSLESRLQEKVTADRCSSPSKSESSDVLALQHLTVGQQKDIGDNNAARNHLYVQKELVRHVNQLFIRGDSIVTVIPVK